MGNSKSQVVSLGARTYQIERMLGSGAFGKVHVIVDCDTTKFYAMKVMSKVRILKKGEKTIKCVLREREFLSQLHHPFIVNMWGAVQDERNLYLVLDMMIGGELNFHLRNSSKGLPETHVQFYAANLLLALEYLHDNEYVHRDLKPENILLNDKGFASLTDFNVASKLDLDGKTVGYSGTRPYMAPEIYRKERYGTAADIWSLGIVLYELLFGSVPWGKKVNTATNKWIDKFDDAAFHGSGELDSQVKRILREEVTLPKGNQSDNCRDFLSRVICPVANRMTVHECKAHPWFADLSFEEIYSHSATPPIIPQITQANVDRNVVFEEMMMGDEVKKEKKVKILPEDQDKFDDWDFLCPVLQKEVEALGSLTPRTRLDTTKRRKRKKFPRSVSRG